MTTDAKSIPPMTELYRRVRLEILSRTEPGDVFYLVTDSSAVWHRGDYEDYPFQKSGSSLWHRQLDLGKPGELVVILHNTRKYCAAPAPAC